MHWVVDVSCSLEVLWHLSPDTIGRGAIFRNVDKIPIAPSLITLGSLHFLLGGLLQRSFSGVRQTKRRLHCDMEKHFSFIVI
jgi:hypothetical protein